MAYRTTYVAVAKIIEIDASITTDLDPFIEVANLLVTDICSADYSDAKLELIERWLSAHFYAMRDPLAETEKAGPVSQKFFGQVGIALDHTRYGQQAMLIDTDGDLAALNRQIKAGHAKITPGVTWAGCTDWDTDNI